MMATSVMSLSNTSYDPHPQKTLETSGCTTAALGRTSSMPLGHLALRYPACPAPPPAPVPPTPRSPAPGASDRLVHRQLAGRSLRRPSSRGGEGSPHPQGGHLGRTSSLPVVQPKAVGLPFSFSNMPDGTGLEPHQVAPSTGQEAHHRLDTGGTPGASGHPASTLQLLTGPPLVPESGAVKKLHLALDCGSGRTVVVKSVMPASPPWETRKLHHEAEVLRKLKGCPNIVRLLGVDSFPTATVSAEDVTGGLQTSVVVTMSLVLEYVAGGSISDTMQRFGGALPEPVVCRYAKGMLEGLLSMHARGVVHCDIKASKVLVCPTTGVPKLCGLGKSMKVGEAAERLSRKQRLQGSYQWMAPEVMRQEDQSPASDIWSFGCSLLEMLTGGTPWAGQVDTQTFLPDLIGRSQRTPHIPAHLSESCQMFLRRCLVRDASQRPTAKELLQDSFILGSPDQKTIDQKPFDQKLFDQKLTVQASAGDTIKCAGEEQQAGAAVPAIATVLAGATGPASATLVAGATVPASAKGLAGATVLASAAAGASGRFRHNLEERCPCALSGSSPALTMPSVAMFADMYPPSPGVVGSGGMAATAAAPVTTATATETMARPRSPEGHYGLCRETLQETLRGSPLPGSRNCSFSSSSSGSRVQIWRREEEAIGAGQLPAPGTVQQGKAGNVLPVCLTLPIQSPGRLNSTSTQHQRSTVHSPLQRTRPSPSKGQRERPQRLTLSSMESPLSRLGSPVLQHTQHSPVRCSAMQGKVGPTSISRSRSSHHPGLDPVVTVSQTPTAIGSQSPATPQNPTAIGPQSPAAPQAIPPAVSQLLGVCSPSGVKMGPLMRQISRDALEFARLQQQQQGGPSSPAAASPIRRTTSNIPTFCSNQPPPGIPTSLSFGIPTGNGKTTPEPGTSPLPATAGTPGAPPKHGLKGLGSTSGSRSHRRVASMQFDRTGVSVALEGEVIRAETQHLSQDLYRQESQLGSRVGSMGTTFP